MSTVSVRDLSNAVFARLQGGWDYWTVYRGDIDPQPPEIPGDPQGRVAPYLVVYGSAGRGYAETLGYDPANLRPDLDWTVQVTVVAGYPEDLDGATDAVHALLDGWTPDVPGAGPLDLVGDPGPLQADTGVRPPRYFAPMVYGSTNTTA